MTTVVPPPATPPPPTPPAPPASVIAAVTAPPPAAMLALPLGARIEALVQTADPALEKLLVQTALGPVFLQLPAPLPIPADVRLVLQLAALSPLVQFLILSVDGSPPSALRPGGAASAAPNASPAAPSAPPTLEAAAPTDRVNIGTVMQATLLRRATHPEPAAPGTPPRSSPAAAPGPPPLDAGGPSPAAARSASLAATIVERISAAVPEKIGAALSSWLTSARADASTAIISDKTPNPGRMAASATPTAPPAGSGPTPPLPPGTAFAVRVSAMHGPAATLPAASGAALVPGQTILATVVSSTPGQALIETGAGTMILKTPEALPKGLRLALEIAGPPRLPATDAPHPSPLQGRGWPALEEALPLLRHEAPDLHRILIATLLPKPDTTLATGIFMFLAALRTGDIRAWFGEDIVRAIGRGRSELLRRIESDFRELARHADDPGNGDWRMAVVPFNAESSIQQIRLLTRRPPREDPGKDIDSTRFVVDVTLSRLGRIQLDGLVRRKDKRLDLMVRTATPLPATMRDDIRRLFTRAGEATGINGLLAFEARETGFIEVKADTAVGGGGVVA